MNDYNEKWCNERHEFIEKEFDMVGLKIKTIEARLWAIIILLVFNFGGIIAVLLKYQNP